MYDKLFYIACQASVKITDMIDCTKVSGNEKIIELIEQREEIEKQIREIDDMALVRYELEALKE